MRQLTPEEFHYELRAAVFKAISGIVYNGNTIPVYDTFAPADAPAWFIIMRAQEDIPLKNKNRFSSEVHITIEAVTRFPIVSGTGRHRDIIAGYILQRLCRATWDLPGHNVLQVLRQFNKTIDEEFSTVRVLRRFQIFKFDISQKFSEEDMIWQVK